MEKVRRLLQTSQQVDWIIDKQDEIVGWINEHEKPSGVPRCTKSELDAKREASELKRRVEEALNKEVK